jgi:transcriptional regulator
MYIPAIFKEVDEAYIRSFIEQYGFATLISEVNGKPWATHIPLLFYPDVQGQSYLKGHMARSNPQWSNIDESKEVLAIFSGPQAYISSSWYNHENVPTWNYQAVHVYGKFRLMPQEALIPHLSELVDKYEKGLRCPVSVHTMSPAVLEANIQGLVGFEITITSIEAVSKLSQNRDAENLQGIIKGLNEKTDTDARNMAALLSRRCS